MAQVAIIIHTKTKNSDYPPSLSVYPSVLEAKEINQIYKMILAATRSIDNLKQNEVRKIVYTCGDFIIVGMVSFLRNMADDNIDDEIYFLDNKERNIYAFIGLVFPKDSQLKDVPIIEKQILWKKFKDYMGPIWERKVFETQNSLFEEIDFEYIKHYDYVPATSVNGIDFYTMNYDDTAVFLYWIAQALNGKSVSFCSNITDFRVIKDKPFTAITTTTNLIERMKVECANNCTPQQHTSPKQIPNNNYNTQEKKNTSKGEPSSIVKNSKKNWINIAGILFVILVLIMLMLKL